MKHTDDEKIESRCGSYSAVATRHTTAVNSTTTSPPLRKMQKHRLCGGAYSITKQEDDDIRRLSRSAVLSANSIVAPSKT